MASLLPKFILLILVVSLVNADNFRSTFPKNRNLSQKSSGLNDICEYDASKPKNLHCKVERGSFLEMKEEIEAVKSVDKLVIVEYNIDRNGRGGDGPNEKGLAGIITAIQSLGDADVILLSEVSRDCPEYDYVNGAEAIAEKLQMSWAYTVEFLDTNSSIIAAGYQCTIGNAILSKKPMSSVQSRRFLSQCCQFDDRSGGRVVLKATIPAYNLTITSSHLESGTGISDFIEAAIVRELQSAEMIFFVSQEESNQLVAIGGDFNSPLRQFNEGKAFKNYVDPLESKYRWPFRNTCVGDTLGYFGLSAFDFVYFRNQAGFNIDVEICKTKICTGFSDHYPLKYVLTKENSSDIL